MNNRNSRTMSAAQYQFYFHLYRRGLNKGTG